MTGEINGDGDRDGGGNGHDDRVGGRTGTRTDKRVEGRESPRTYEVIEEGGSEDMRGGATPTSTLATTAAKPDASVRPSHHAEDQSPGTGSGRAEEGRRSARNPRSVTDAMWKTGETWAVEKKNVDKESVSTVDVDRGYLENSIVLERKQRGKHKALRAFK